MPAPVVQEQSFACSAALPQEVPSMGLASWAEGWPHRPGPAQICKRRATVAWKGEVGGRIKFLSLPLLILEGLEELKTHTSGQMSPGVFVK